MHRLKIAAATRHFGQPLRTAIRSAGAAGAHGIQIEVHNELKPTELSETGRRQFKYQLDQSQLRLATFEFQLPRALHDQTQLDATVAALKSSLQFSFLMGVKVLVARIGRIPEDLESPEFELLCDVLNDIARHSNHVGTTLAITPTVDSVDTLAATFSRVTEGPLGLNLDPGGLVMGERDPLATYQAFHDRLLSVQLRDGQRDVDGQGLEAAVGMGEVVWDELLALLDEGGFDGWFVATRSQGDDRAGDMARAIKFIRNISMDH